MTPEQRKTLKYIATWTTTAAEWTAQDSEADAASAALAEIDLLALLVEKLVEWVDPPDRRLMLPNYRYRAEMVEQARAAIAKPSR